MDISDVHNTMSVIEACAQAVYNELGWGWKECVYREALAVELRRNNMDVSTEVAHAIKFKGEPLSNVFAKVDMLVNTSIVVELKTCNSPTATERAIQQCQRYLRCCADIQADNGMVICFPDSPNGVVTVVAT